MEDLTTLIRTKKTIKLGWL